MENQEGHAGQGKRALLSAILGVVLIAVILLIVLNYPCPSNSQYVVFRITLSLAVAGFAAIIPGFFNFKYKASVTAGGALAVFAFTYVMNPKLVEKISSCSEPFNYTFFIENENGEVDENIVNDAISMKLGNDKKKASIGEDGVVDFKMIPANFKDSTVRINLNSDLWQFENQKNAIDVTLTGYSQTIIITPHRDLCCVEGIVRDFDRNKLEGVVVTVAGVSDTTGADGIFNIEVKPEDYASRYLLEAELEGFETREMYVHPSSPEPENVVLSEEN